MIWKTPNIIRQQFYIEDDPHTRLMKIVSRLYLNGVYTSSPVDLVMPHIPWSGVEIHY